MPLELSNTFLLERAFAPAPIPKVGEDKLAALYNETPDYAAEVTRGTLEEKENLTFEEEKGLEKFHRQFNTIIAKLKSACQELKIDAQLIPNLDEFAGRFLSRKYYVKQGALFYTQIKVALESILINLSGNTLQRSEDKKRIMTDLLKNIIYCGPGVFNHIQTARQELESHNTIPAWLAKFRKIIIKQLAQEHLIRKGISQNNMTHVENVFLKHALNKEWYPYGYETLDAINEIHIGLAQVGEEDIIIFEKEFLKRFNPTSIMTELSQTLSTCLLDKIEKTRSEKNADQDFVLVKTNTELAELFSGVPILNEENTLLVAFSASEAKEDKGSKSPAFIRFGDDLRIKPHADLMLSMTRYFVELKEGQLFQALTQEAKGQPITLIPDSPKLSYSTTAQDDIFPYDEKVIVEIDLATFKQFKFPIYAAQLKYFYELGERDFTGCVFENVDFTQPIFKDLSELKLEKAQFRNSKINADQFKTLWEREWNSTSDAKQEDRILRLAKELKGQGILFYAVLHNLPDVIHPLMNTSEDDLVLLPEQKITAIELAANMGHWACVKKLARRDVLFAPDDFIGGRESPYRKRSHAYEEVALKAALNSQCDVINHLRTLHMTFDIRDKRTGKTPLYSAAEYGNLNMVRTLLAAGAHQIMAGPQQRQPILIAAINRHWDCVKALSTKQDPHNLPQHHFALLAAAEHNQTDIVISLLEKGTYPEAFWNGGDANRPLHWAAHHGNIAMAKALLAKNCWVTHRNAKNQDHLEVAAIAGQWEYIKNLMQLTRHYGHHIRVIEMAANAGQWQCVEVIASYHSPYPYDNDDITKVDNTVLKAIRHHQLPSAFLLSTKLYDRNKQDALVTAFKSIPGIRGRIAVAILDYYYDGGSWILKPASERRKTDIVNLLRIITDEKEDTSVVEKVFNYCQNEIKTGRLNNSALRTKVVNAILPYPNHFLKGNRNKILEAILNYQEEGGSWTSKPHSQRREADVYHLMKLVSEDQETENKMPTSVEQRIRFYCENNIKTGFWNRSALRSKVLEALDALPKPRA